MFSKALLISSLVSVAFASVSVTTPVASTVDSGGKSAQVVWMDDGAPPTLQAFGNSTISIYTGNSIQQTNLQVLSNGTDVSAVSSITFTPDPTIGPNSDKYFIRFESISNRNATTGAFYEAFSAQFTLDSMTGTFSASVSAEIAGLSTAPLGAQTSSGSASPSSSSAPSLTTGKPSSASSSTSATAKPSSGAMGLKAGWAGMVFGAVVGFTLF